VVSLVAWPFPTPLLGVLRSAPPTDIPRMDPAFSPAPIGAPETHHVLRDGTLVAVLRLLPDRGSFTVAAELREDHADNAVLLRQYTFARLDEASAFLAEAASSFAFLGCEIQRA
jgi:hypothetical protein